MMIDTRGNSRRETARKAQEGKRETIRAVWRSTIHHGDVSLSVCVHLPVMRSREGQMRGDKGEEILQELSSEHKQELASIRKKVV
jgi:hypothetical protein